MKVKVYVTLKAGVLDPQGKAIGHSAQLIGYANVQNVRQGKYFEVTLDDSLCAAQARDEVEQFAREVLANPVIEDYRVEIDG